MISSTSILFYLILPQEPQEILEIKNNNILFGLYHKILIYEIFLNELHFVNSFNTYPKLYGDLISIIELKYNQFNLISYSYDAKILFWKRNKNNNYIIQTIISIDDNYNIS